MKISTRLKDPHCKAGYKYAENIVSEKIPACLYVRQACQRSIDDFNKQSTRTFPYRFDSDKGSRVCRFVENLRHVKGDLVNQKIKLDPFQSWMLTQIFGWLDNEGNRRFRNALIVIPRGNAKSTIMSAVSLYMLAADAEQADVYSAATKKDQAKIVWLAAAQMAKKSPELCSSLGILVSAHKIEVPSRNCISLALSSEDQGLDGLNISCGVIDELAQHPNSKVYDAIVTGAGKRPSSLILCITTAGSNMLSPGYQQQEYIRQILNGTVRDEQRFGVIWTIDDTDDWSTEASLIKANPGWKTCIDPTYNLGQLHAAKNSPAVRPSYLQKHLNVWTSSDTEFIPMDAWHRNKDPNLDLAQFRGEPVWIGLDLASKRDLSARVLLFRRDIDGEKHYYLFGRAYLPDAAINKTPAYQGWQLDNRLSVTPGEITDYQLILDDLRDDCRSFQVQKIAVDPWQASFLMQKLTEDGAPAIEFPNNTATMSNPMKELAAMVAAGRLHHNGDPVLTWCMGNLVAHLDKKDNVFPNKNMEASKIDLAVAAIFAIGVEMTEPPASDIDQIYFVPFR